MGIKRALTFHPNPRTAPLALGFLFAAGLVLISALAVAQEQATPNLESATERRLFRIRQPLV